MRTLHKDKLTGKIQDKYVHLYINDKLLSVLGSKHNAKQVIYDLLDNFYAESQLKTKHGTMQNIVAKKIKAKRHKNQGGKRYNHGRAKLNDMAKKQQITVPVYISQNDINNLFGDKETLKQALKKAANEVINQARIKAENKAI